MALQLWESHEPQIRVSLVQDVFSVPEPVVRNFVGLIAYENLLFLCTVGILNVQVNIESTVRGKYHPRAIWVPDRRYVKRGVEVMVGKLYLQFVAGGAS